MLSPSAIRPRGVTYVTDFSRSHLSDGALLVQAHDHCTDLRTSTAALLADLAEVEARQLHRTGGYSSMRAWCTGELKMSDDAILDRIQAARTAREYPAIFPLLADGRLHLTAVLMLSKHLTPANAIHLLAGAAGKSKSEIAEFLAHQFPSTEVMPMIIPAPGSAIESPDVCRTNDGVVPERPRSSALVTTPTSTADSGRSASARIAPVAGGRHLFQFMGSDAQRDLANQVLDLSGRGDLAALFFRGLELVKRELQKQKFAATDRPRRARRSSTNPRHIPAAVRRAVWKRDGGRCTFVGDHGHRCEARRGLEFDHIDPVGRGGEPTIARVRLLCRAHNQLEAERVYGREFMNGKREEARARRDERRHAAAARNEPEFPEADATVSNVSDDAPAHTEHATAESEVQARERAEAESVAMQTALARVQADALARAEAHEQLLDTIAGLKWLGFRVERARWVGGDGAEPGPDARTAHQGGAETADSTTWGDDRPGAAGRDGDSATQRREGVLNTYSA